MTLQTLTLKQIDAIENEVKMLLHASRDCYRNQDRDVTKFQFDTNDAYYSECYGILRALRILGYGKFGSVNILEETSNLSWWFGQLKDEVLREENFGGNGQCDHCLKMYGKDDAGRKREDL